MRATLGKTSGTQLEMHTSLAAISWVAVGVEMALVVVVAHSLRVEFAGSHVARSEVSWVPHSLMCQPMHLQRQQQQQQRAPSVMQRKKRIHGRKSTVLHGTVTKSTDFRAPWNVVRLRQQASSLPHIVLLWEVSTADRESTVHQQNQSPSACIE